jgi:NAD(P)-dependent dehydrogenase (short-subunit alcohol dehydrogenase family)
LDTVSDQVRARVLISDLNPPKDPTHDFDFHKADVSKWSDLIALMETAKAKFGSIDMVCANVRARMFETFLTIAGAEILLGGHFTVS